LFVRSSVTLSEFGVLRSSVRGVVRKNPSRKKCSVTLRTKSISLEVFSIPGFSKLSRQTGGVILRDGPPVYPSPIQPKVENVLVPPIIDPVTIRSLTMGLPVAQVPSVLVGRSTSTSVLVHPDMLVLVETKPIQRRHQRTVNFLIEPRGWSRAMSVELLVVGVKRIRWWSAADAIVTSEFGI
jgi:hypothetical protein